MGCGKNYVGERFSEELGYPFIDGDAFVPETMAEKVAKFKPLGQKDIDDFINNHLIPGVETAYDDSLGITAKFNLNILSRINDELDADFNLKNFEHVAKYNDRDQRIEMYLKSTVNQSVVISKANISLKLKEGEMIHTEHSHKYTIPQIHELMNNAGFTINNIWSDKNNHYALVLVSKK